MEFEEKTLGSQEIYSGKVLKIKKDEVLLPNGNTSYREIVEHCGGSSVLAEEDGKILLVKQFRYAFKKCLWEIPAGKLNKGEDSKETAFRELEEECGYSAQEMEKLFDVYPTPGYSNEIIRIYRAHGLKKTAVHLDEDEFLTCEWIEKARIKQMIKDKEIVDAKTLIALLYVL